jgi:hypothetical protein
VTPDQSQTLQAVKGRGEITLVPRMKDEPTAGVGPSKVTLEDVLGIEPPAEPEPTVVFATEIFRRGDRKLNLFRDRNSAPQDEELRDLPTFDPTALPQSPEPPPEKPQQ